MLRAQTPSENVDAYQHLYQVNKEWKHFAVAAPAEKIHFANDTKRIRFHLETVIHHLSKLVPTENTKAVQEKRASLLAELKTYAEQEVFPQNIYHKNRQPYFIDNKGTHCAVGYLMKVSGADDLAVQISKEHNYDYLPNIKTEGVIDWAVEHGFSLKELALIQPGYAANEPFEELGKGANGPVNKMFQTWNKLYIAGDFDLLDSLPCLNVGVYEMGQLSCLGNGVDGKVNDIVYTYGATSEVVVVGDLIHGGNHYPIATYQAANGWTFDSIPGRPNAEGVHIVEGFNIGVVIKDVAIAGMEVWEQSGGTWEVHYTFHGTILDVNESWMYVGLFDSLTVHQSMVPDTVLYSHNAVALYNDITIYSFSVLDTLMPDTIQAVETIGNIIYFGGYSNNPLKPCLTRFLNNTLQPLIFEHEMLNSNNEPKILDLKADPNSGNLYIAGNMRYTPFFGNFWTSIGKYNTGTGVLEGYNNFDSSVTSIAFFEGDLIIGGLFTSTGGFGGQQWLSHLARLDVPTNVHTIEGELTLKLFPNPTSSDVTIDLGSDYVDASVEVSNALGQVVYQEKYFSTNVINLSLEGASGMYLVKIKTEDSESIVKVLKY
jgi:hypothetical protein